MDNKIFIEEYRGFDIYFLKFEEVFSCISGEFDTQKEKKSLSLAKKSIDEYIKDNIDFKPIWVEQMEDRYVDDSISKKLIAIRKDGRFVFENNKGEPQQMSEYDEKRFWIKNPINESVYKDIDEYNKQIRVINKTISNRKKDFVKEDFGLVELKKKYMK